MKKEDMLKKLDEAKKFIEEFNDTWNHIDKNPFFTEEEKAQLRAKSQAREDEYNEYIKINEGKKIIGYNPENFWPIFENDKL